jgi:hypothetical protein
VDENRLSRGERLIGVSAVALLGVSFLHWLGGRITSVRLHGGSLPSRGFHIQRSAWGYTATAAAVVIGLAMLTYVLARLGGAGPPRGRLAARALTALGAVASLLVLLQLVAGAPLQLADFGLPSVSNLGVQVPIEKTRDVGIYLGLIATLGLTAGGYLTLSER